ncbi:ATP dependent RNA helicase (Dbp5), putative [Talaromyces stipitatus ATCC 10500]|uniref:RNA helicase n=1 Tax=Talaromyces stipitatus (strain ATCC 10500 / CBS 375.48 / QM 6759 / NRRL 1006) TaxID=441959 RepID=B8M5F0_TALSN|nr:ATP dependent RNA helicase (Dbp5), putative [Talaromyces stipitatus ATCC 10500]EED19756.1 ATP dependent RNA helicase (Dbp5), putative [Talaromyces stipitatus ATCC 10500]
MASENPNEGKSLADRITKPDAESTETQTSGGADTDGASEVQGGSNLQEPEYDVEVKLSDLQADPNNPLFSVKSFEDLGLSPSILQGLYAMKFLKPSKIQERALPLLLHNPPTNMIGQSQSGTGKTAAFTLNILSRLDLSTDEMRKSPQALILAPSRELARQIGAVVSEMGRFMEGLSVAMAVPTEGKRPGRLEHPVVCGTPGTVMDLIKKRILIVNKLKVLVLDEADNMLDQQGLGDQCIRVKGFLPKTVQVVLFSATFDDQIRLYAAKFAPNANKISLKQEELTVEGIRQFYLDCVDDNDKYNVLVKFYGLLTVASSIIFVQTRQTAAEIEKRMTKEGHTVASLTGGVEGSVRDKIIDEFREGRAKVLITTNVLARGIDVSTVSMVINYDIPEHYAPGRSRTADPQTYLHRIGRTGRFGRVGVAISFVSSREEWQMLMDISKYLHTNIEGVHTRDWDEVENLMKKIIKNPRARGDFPTTA